MVEANLQIVLRRHDSTRNVSRYYVLAIEPSLYGDAALVRAWGRIGSRGRQRLDLYATPHAAGEAHESSERAGRCPVMPTAGNKHRVPWPLDKEASAMPLRP
jgi:predicted DNA-binding WGR domain protein